MRAFDSAHADRARRACGGASARPSGPRVGCPPGDCSDRSSLPELDLPWHRAGRPSNPAGSSPVPWEPTCDAVRLRPTRTGRGDAPGADPDTDVVEQDDEDDGLRCRSCGRVVAWRRDVFAMGPPGAVQMQINPHGYLHEFVTVRRAVGLRIVGPGTTEHTWFPGYAWSIAYCAGCGAHIGWRFDAVAPARMPRCFFALRCAQVQ